MPAPWGEITPGGSSAGFDTTAVIDEILPSLHADARAHLQFWTEGELIQWMDEAVKRLAALTCAWVGTSSATSTVIGQPTYSLPARHLATLYVGCGGQGLRGANAAELEGRDSAYRTAQGTPASWYEDYLGLGSIGLAPVPAAVAPLAMVYAGYPPTLDALKVRTQLDAPEPLKSYLGLAVLAGAYGQEGEAEMPDVAAHCQGMLSLYEQALVGYFGKAL